MCVICKGLKNKKMSIQEAEEKYEEFIELDVLDEDHQEVVEELIAMTQDEIDYWDLAKKDALQQEIDDDFDENEFIHSELGEDDVFGGNDD